MNASLLFLLAGACGLGMAHAFEVDHMATVSAFVAQKSKPRQATLFGIKWTIGHGFSLLLLGTLLFVLRLSLSEQIAGSLERLVGVALFVLGVWILTQLRASFLGQSLVAVSQSYWKVFAFTLSFSFGVLLAMDAYSAVLGSILTLGGRRSTVAIHGVRALTGAWACVVGIYWVLK